MNDETKSCERCKGAGCEHGGERCEGCRGAGTSPAPCAACGEMTTGRFCGELCEAIFFEFHPARSRG